MVYSVLRGDDLVGHTVYVSHRREIGDRVGLRLGHGAPGTRFRTCRGTCHRVDRMARESSLYRCYGGRAGLPYGLLCDSVITKRDHLKAVTVELTADANYAVAHASARSANNADGGSVRLRRIALNDGPPAHIW